MQYMDLLAENGNDSKALVNIYGAEHLLRLLGLYAHAHTHTHSHTYTKWIVNLFLFYSNL